MKHILRELVANAAKPWIALDSSNTIVYSSNEIAIPDFDVRIKFAAPTDGQVLIILDKTVCSDIIVNGKSIYDAIDSDGYYNTNAAIEVYYKFVNLDGHLPSRFCKIGYTESGESLNNWRNPFDEIEFNDTITDLVSYTQGPNDANSAPGIAYNDIAAKHVILPDTLAAVTLDGVISYLNAKVITYKGVDYNTADSDEVTFITTVLVPNGVLYIERAF